MLWAQWGLKDRLVTDVDIWLCHQCHDCTRRCPRGARPGDVMAAIRRETILHFAWPGFLGRWVNEPWFLAVLMLVPVILFGLIAWRPFGVASLYASTGDPIVIPTWWRLPQIVLIAIFGGLAVLDVGVLAVGVGRFWRGLDRVQEGRREGRQEGDSPALFSSCIPDSRGRSWGAATWSVVKAIVRHDDFASCGTGPSIFPPPPRPAPKGGEPRVLSHMLVVFGFIAVGWVDLVVLTARFNPLLGDFAYPFNFWSPWKILANLGGLAIVAGVLLMVRDRLLRRNGAGLGTYFDWMFLVLVLLVPLTGFVSEALHYARIDVLRQAAYLFHLVPAFVLLVFLPYSKLAHALYRTAALIHAARSGRWTGVDHA